MPLTITEELYGVLFKDHFASLTTFCLRFNIEEAAAEDLVIQQFLNLWNGRAKYSFKSVNQIKTFLYNSTRNASINYLKKIGVEKKALSRMVGLTEGIQMPEDSPGTLEKNAKTMIAAIESVYKAIADLPPQQRTVVVYSLRRMTAKEIALKMNLSEKAIYKYRELAMQKLKKKFSGKIPALM